MSFVLQAPIPMYGLLFPDNLKKNPQHFVEFAGTKLVMVYCKHNVSIATTMRNLASLIDAPIHTRTFCCLTPPTLRFTIRPRACVTPCTNSRRHRDFRGPLTFES